MSKWYKHLLSLLLATVSLQMPILLPAALATESVPTQISISLPELEHTIGDRLKRVEEFRFIEEEAAKLGVRAWLFGGTAAGYAHYVKWDMQREKGDSRFQKDRFDYDYTNIYRSTQDLDIVIDGNPEQAQKLQAALQQKYPHLQGSKTAWEVRLLTQDMGDKQAILNNPDFMNQHTDSNSTGLIEITKPKPGESIVRDVRDWNAKQPYFLKDVHDGALHYYFSASHDATKFAREGRNPPILSVIRFLTKAFQYELKIRPEDLAQIKTIIDRFDPKRDTQNSYVAHWIEKNGKKLFQNAVNIEYAWDTIESLGLRNKLKAVKNNADTVESLAWWMNKEPLRTKVLGQGAGRTARELGLDIVAHETNNFLAYESITRAHTGDSNVLISRANATGEAAVYGNGFYTKLGREGARGTGLTIRFHLDPNARENTDFDLAKSPNGETFAIVKNKSAVKVIPESLNIGPVEYFQMLARSENELSDGDRGILEKLKRRIGSKASAISLDQENKIVEIIKAEIERSGLSPVVTQWFALPNSHRHPELVEALIKKGTANWWVVQRLVTQPHWPDREKWINSLINAGDADQKIIEYVLSDPHWKNHPEWVERLIQKSNVYDADIAQHVLSKPHWEHRSDWVETLIQRRNSDKAIAMYVLSQPHWKNHPEWVEHFLQKGNVNSALAVYVLSQPHWGDHPELVERLIRAADENQSSGVGNAIVRDVLSQPHWAGHPEWVEHYLKAGDQDIQIAASVLTQPHWKDHPEWVETLLKRGLYASVARNVVTQPHWKDHPEWVKTVLEADDLHIGYYENALSPAWVNRPEYIEIVIRRYMRTGQKNPELLKETLSDPKWRDHPGLRQLTGGHAPTYLNLKVAYERKDMALKGSCITQSLGGILGR